MVRAVVFLVGRSLITLPGSSRAEVAENALLLVVAFYIASSDRVIFPPLCRNGAGGVSVIMATLALGYALTPWRLGSTQKHNGVGPYSSVRRVDRAAALDVDCADARLAYGRVAARSRLAPRCSS